MKPQSKFVVSTEMIKVIDNGSNYIAHIRMSKGGWVEHEPFPHNLQGLVAALDLSTQVCAGKFFLKSIVASSGPALDMPEPIQITSKK